MKYPKILHLGMQNTRKGKYPMIPGKMVAAVVHVSPSHRMSSSGMLE